MDEVGHTKSSFFHRFMMAKKRKNTILDILSSQGQSLLNEEGIVGEFIQLFKHLYTKNQSLALMIPCSSVLLGSPLLIFILSCSFLRRFQVLRLIGVKVPFWVLIVSC